MSLHKHHWQPGLLVLALLVALAGCQPAARAPQEIRIGLVAYLEGDYVEYSGRPTVNAANLAIEPVNAAGGLELGGQRYPVRLVIKGIQNNPQLAATAVQRLINQEDVVAVVGPQFSSDAIPAGAIAQAAGVPLITPMATHPQVTLGRQHVFRMGFVDDFQGRAAALFAYRDLAARQAAMLYDTADPYSRGVAQVFQETFTALGGQVAAAEVFISGDQDFTAQLQRIARQAPDIIFLPNYTEDALRQGRQARRLGLALPLLGSDGWELNAFNTTPEFEGAYFTTQWSSQSPDPASQAFVALYQEKYAQPPNGTAAQTYDALNLLFEAIQAQGSFTPGDISAGLYALGPYHGVCGPIDFIDRGDPVKSVVVLQIRDGQDLFYRTIEPPGEEAAPHD